jgi:protein TonB
LAALASCATAELIAPDPAPGFYYQRTPTSDDLLRAYPPRAWDQEIGGFSLLECDVSPHGDLRNCVVLRETPAGMGFGAAGLRIVGKFRIAAREPGVHISHRVRLPINWRVG